MIGRGSRAIGWRALPMAAGSGVLAGCHDGVVADQGGAGAEAMARGRSSGGGIWGVDPAEAKAVRMGRLGFD